MNGDNLTCTSGKPVAHGIPQETRPTSSLSLIIGLPESPCKIFFWEIKITNTDSLSNKRRDWKIAANSKILFSNVYKIVKIAMMAYQRLSGGLGFYANIFEIAAFVQRDSSLVLTLHVPCPIFLKVQNIQSVTSLVYRMAYLQVSWLNTGIVKTCIWVLDAPFTCNHYVQNVFYYIPLKKTKK